MTGVPSGHQKSMDETDLQLHPAEASELCELDAPDLLARRRWDRALLTVMDEAPVESALAVLGHERGAEPGSGWRAEKLRLDLRSGQNRTEDAEACARHAGWIYVFGSQFGSEDGPLEAKRSWVARMRDDELSRALAEGATLPAELVRLRFGIHRAVNDVFAGAKVDLMALGAASREAYIDQTIRRGARKKKRWSGSVRSSDRPINVEGVEFRANGNLLLGLRYPVTAEGAPVLVEMEGVERLFEDPQSLPRCTAVWWLEGVGDPEQPVGIRALFGDGVDSFHAIVGNLESTGKRSAILADHPEGARAASTHVRFSLPAAASGGAVMADVVHRFDDLRRVEGVAVAADGQAHYVIDREGDVALRTLVLDRPDPAVTA